MNELQGAELESPLVSREGPKKAPPKKGPDYARVEDFWADMAAHMYLHVPTGALWPSASVNARVKPWPEVNGKPIRPSAYLDMYRAIDQRVWVPGMPQIIEGQVLQGIGWLPHEGARAFNEYRPPLHYVGDPDNATPWVEHLRRIYPEDWAHIVRYFAHCVQRPGDKINHALVLGGGQGIGKDSLLAPLREAVGSWNCSDISPTSMLGRFNGWARCKLLIVSEARDLGDADRTTLYERNKALIATPPPAIRVDEKHRPETYVINAMGIVFTTNHATSGLYLPVEDRRHYVAWSPVGQGDLDTGYFARLHAWYDTGGIGHVIAYLHDVLLTDFDPKAPPPKTAAFWSMAGTYEDPEVAELRDVIEALDSPPVVTLEDIARKAEAMHLFVLANDIRDTKGRRRIPHLVHRVGYAVVRNEGDKGGAFRVGGRRAMVYGRSDLSTAQHMEAIKRLKQ